jgi:tripartite ATP-independent transporter DctP family solute receptor
VLPRFAKSAEFTYKLANNLPVTHPSSIRQKEAAERILKATDGRLQVDVYPAGQLGTDTDMLSQLRAGALEMFHLSGVILSTLLPVASINGIGFAFKDYATVWSAIDGELGAYLRGQISKVGLIAFEKIFDNGYRQITTASKPINTPDDLKNLKIRVPPSPLWTSMFKAFGAAPATVNWAETYSALQTKIVDGQENPLTLIEIAKLYEVQKYVAMTNHMWDGFWLLANADSFKALPAKFQDIVQENLNQAAMEQRADLQKVALTAADTLKANGMTFTNPDPLAFRAVLKKEGWYADWKQKLGNEAWAILEKYSGPLV